MDEDIRGTRPWRPAGLREVPARSVARLSYVVVEEIVGDRVVLAVHDWPRTDRLGRHRFHDAADRGHVVVHRSELRGVVYDGWLLREPRVGDTFAARIAPRVQQRLAGGDDVLLDGSLRLTDVLQGEVRDVSAEARTVGKVAYFAAMSPTVPLEEVVRRGQGDSVVRPDVVEPRRLGARPWTGPVIAEAAVTTTAPPGGLPRRLLEATPAGEFLREITEEPESLVYFLLNVGDGDTQLVLLPAEGDSGRRRALVVDVGTTRKLVDLVTSLADRGVLLDPRTTPGVFPVVVATHPHDDHIGGMAHFLDQFGRAGQIGDFWEPGYYHPTATFVEMMAVLEECVIPRTQPTSGMTRWAGDVKITVLAPSVSLRVRYDSYGVGVNDSSIALKLEFPAGRVAHQLDERRRARVREYLRLDGPWTLILGADAQNASWAHVTADFPQLTRRFDTPLFRELAAARGRDHLSGDVLKVSHHASKHGANLELVERIHADLALVSSVCGGGKYNFPHLLATEAIREAMQGTTSDGEVRLPDHRLGIHYTGATVTGDHDPRPAGSIAVVLSPKRGTALRMWRFGDSRRQLVDLDGAVRLRPVRSPR